MIKKKNQNLEPEVGLVEPPPDLFLRIISAIRREKELQKTKKTLFYFLLIFIISLIAIPFSGSLMLNELEKSGFFHFVSTATNDLKIFFLFWQDYLLAILESLPILSIIIFNINIIIFLFTLRFLLKKKILLIYSIWKSKRITKNLFATVF